MNSLWSSRGWLARLLTPIAALFGLVVSIRSVFYKTGLLKSIPSAVPVIVVGNISVGGTGKTPLVIAVIRQLQSAGFHPGIVSRGYGAVSAKEPRLITADTTVAWAGDEPAMLHRETGVPVCICTARAAAVDHLVNTSNVNVVVSDDGLQHYAMQRDIEIAVVDGQRLLGNGWLLPAGPLREPASRLNRVDVIAVQQPAGVSQTNKNEALDRLALNQDKLNDAGSFELDVVKFVNLQNNTPVAINEFSQCRVHAVAGVGNPQRFFASLTQRGLDVIEHAMPDHHKYQVEHVKFDDGLPVFMTAKDAVKVRELGIDLNNMYEVSVLAVLDGELDVAIDRALSTLQSHLHRTHNNGPK